MNFCFVLCVCVCVCIALRCLHFLHFVILLWHQKAPPMAFTHSLACALPAGQHEKGIEDLRAEASAVGVADLEAALASLQPSGPASTVGISTQVRLIGDSYDAGAADVAKPCHRPSSTVCSVPCLPQVRYVEALMRWNAHQKMRKQKMGLSMVLQGPMAVHVHAKASDNKKEEQLRKAVVACKMELQIDPGKLAGPRAVGWTLCCWLCVCFVLLRMCSALPSTCARL